MNISDNGRFLRTPVFSILSPMFFRITFVSYLAIVSIRRYRMSVRLRLNSHPHSQRTKIPLRRLHFSGSEQNHLPRGLGELVASGSSFWLASEGCRHSPASLIDQLAVSLLFGHSEQLRYSPISLPIGWFVVPRLVIAASVRQRFVEGTAH